MKKARKSDATRTQIMDAAAKMFRRKGYSASTLKKIAGIVNIQAPAIYYYFDTKEKLLKEVLDIGIDRIHSEVQNAVDALAPEASSREKIEVAVRAHLTTLLRYSDYTAANIANYGFAPKKIQRQHLVRREKYNECWNQLLEEAQRTGKIGPKVDINLLRLFLLSALFWTHEWYTKDQGSIEELAAKISTMLFDGIG